MDTLTVTSPTFTLKSRDGKVTVEKVLTGPWTKYSVGTEELYLHSKLGVESATTLCLWEDVNDSLKVTRDEDDKVVGVAVKKG